MTLIPTSVPAPTMPRRRQQLMGTAIASAAVAAFTFTLLGRYLALRAANIDTWLGENNIPLTQPNMQMGTLVLSLFTAQWAVWAIARDERGQSYLALGVTALLGVAFLNQTTFLWTVVGLEMSQLEGPYFYALTASNFAFVAVGLVYLLLMGFRTLGGQFDSKYPEGLSAAVLFWYVNVALYSVIWYAVYITK